MRVTACRGSPSRHPLEFVRLSRTLVTHGVCCKIDARDWRALTEEAKFITGLVEPRRIRFDAQGQLYVGDRGMLRQVKVWTPSV